MRAVVKNVAKYIPTAIISGRSRDKVFYIFYIIFSLMLCVCVFIIIIIQIIPLFILGTRVCRVTRTLLCR